jgi:hypothetical protein
MIKRFVAERGLVAEEAGLRRGQALIWSANLLHGGSPIRDLKRSRHSQVTHYYFEGCSYFTPLLSDSERGRYRRYPVDIRSGRLRAGIENGDALPIPVKMQAKAWVQRNLRYVTNFRR